MPNVPTRPPPSIHPVISLSLLMEQYSPSKPTRTRPLSFALPSSSSSTTTPFSFNSRPLSPDSNSNSTTTTTGGRPRHRSTASLSSLAQLNLNGASSSSHTPPLPLSPRTPGLERSPSLHWGTFSTPQTPDSNNGVGKEFEHVQNKTFAKWLNARLEPSGYPPVKDLGTDFCDGTRLIQLVEILTEVSIGRYNLNPVLRVQKMENTKKALDRIKQTGIYLTNIGPEDIVDGNRKLILGMIWSLVLRFSIAEINQEGSHAKEGLLLWCQRKTSGYESVQIKDFTKSWTDGLAFCALIHRHRPDLLDYSSLPKTPSIDNSISNLSLAFKIAQEALGIPKLLDVEDLVTIGGKQPDERSLMTYVAQFFHCFSSKAQQENEFKILSNFVENMSELMFSVHDYEKRFINLSNSISAHLETISAALPTTHPYPTLQTLLNQFNTTYSLQTRPSWLKEKHFLIGLLFRIKEKLKTYSLRTYEPPEGMKLKDLTLKWNHLNSSDRDWVNKIQKEIEKLRRQVKNQVKNLVREIGKELIELERIFKQLSETAGFNSLEVQLNQIESLKSDKISRVYQLLNKLDELESKCLSLDVQIPISIPPESEESESSSEDYSCFIIQSSESLKLELLSIDQEISQQINFIEKQLTLRNTSTKLNPEQIEEFESAFKAFDKDSTNRLGLDELIGALGSLGVAEINLEEIQQSPQDGKVEFKEFIRFLTARNEDRLTGEKVKSCFRSIASEKGYITELDLIRLQLPKSSLEFLKTHMPQSKLKIPTTNTTNTTTQGGGVEQEEMKEEIVLDYEEFLNQFLE
ncbi:hypothetical protein JCM3765_004693 [Sporobolomyces pararoseus]